MYNFHTVNRTGGGKYQHLMELTHRRDTLQCEVFMTNIKGGNNKQSNQD